MAHMNIIIYKSHFELIKDLTDEQSGKLIKAIGLYSEGVMPEIDDLLVKGIFISIRRDFDLQAENYEKKVKANRENGKNGGRPKKPNVTEGNPNNPMGLLVTQHNPQNLKDKDKDKDKDIEKDKDIDNNTVSTDTVVSRRFITIDNKIDFDKLTSEIKNH
jgi:hypothetical protein